VILRRHVMAARRRLVDAGVDPAEAARDAMLLGRHALGWDAATWLSRQADPAPPGFDPVYAALVERRVAREPVAYIRGLQEFWGRDFLVTPAVLIPRPETELIVEIALSCVGELPPSRAVCDLGTGSGCLAVSLAAERPAVRVVATDVSEAAIAVARANAARFGAADRIEFRVGAYLAGADGPFQLVMANPPYVAEIAYPALPPEVRTFEPRLALAGGADGLRDIRRILELCTTALAPGGVLLMEIGHDQSDAVRRLVSAAGSLRILYIRRDLQGIPRTVVAQRAEPRRASVAP